MIMSTGPAVFSPILRVETYDLLEAQMQMGVHTAAFLLDSRVAEDFNDPAPAEMWLKYDPVSASATLCAQEAWSLCLAFHRG